MDRKTIIISAGLIAASLLGAGSAVYRNLPGAAARAAPDACGYRETIAENLRIAAETLRVPAAVISIKEESTEDAARTAAAVGGQGEQFIKWALDRGQLAYSVNEDQATLSTWGNPSQKEPAYHLMRYRFPRGSLTADSALPEILTQLQTAGAGHQVGVTIASTMVWTLPRDEYYRGKALARDWTLKDVARWFEADPALTACVIKTVPVFRGGPVAETDLPMVDLRNGRYVGFTDAAVITYAEGEGLFGGGSQITWYSVSGLKPTDQPGTPAKQWPQKSKAEIARAQAEAEFAAFRMPVLEDVGEVEYTRAAEESVRLGERVKTLGVELYHLHQEITDPMSAEAKLK
ncbi:MAG TPA: hypothetical protein VD969_05800 [Symbiobacteriaceae bacterium]|nr:hypothetical protein [Symbiobacteriaceae bacterium]